MADFFFDTNDATGGAFYFASNDASSSVPIIDSLNSQNPANGFTLVITGRNFSASGNSVTLGGIAQTVTAENATSISITVARGTNKYGLALPLIVTDSLSAVSAAHTVSSIVPPSGWAYVNLSGTLVSAGLRITAIADIAAGDQLAYETESGVVSIYSDGHVQIASGFSTPIVFDVECWVSGSGWGSVGTQTFNDIGTLAGLTFPLDGDNSLPLIGISFDWYVSLDFDSAAIDSGTTVTNGAGNLVLTLLTAGPGDRWLHYKRTTSDDYAAARPVTLV